MKFLGDCELCTFFVHFSGFLTKKPLKRRWVFLAALDRAARALPFYFFCRTIRNYGGMDHVRAELGLAQLIGLRSRHGPGPSWADAALGRAWCLGFLSSPQGCASMLD